jgi:hypothetical protein
VRFFPRATTFTAREERARRRRNVILAHQALANEERRNAGLGEPGEIVRCEYTTLADHDTVGRNQSRQPLGCRERRLEGFQVSVVDADQPRFEPQCPLKLLLIVDLDEHVHAERKRRRFKLRRFGVFQRGHDDEDAIGAGGARFRHLVGIVHKILAQHRQGARRARPAQMLERAPERGRVGQYR